MDIASHWYTPLRSLQSLGSTSARPGSLAGLAAARRANLSQFFSPEAVAALMWRIATPAMDDALARKPGSRVALLDTSVGSGRLFQFADPDRHELAGADVHGPSVEALSAAAESAGFKVDLVHAGLETLEPTGFGVALLNPPFSIVVDQPTVRPLPGNSYGRFGPASSAISHRYAVEQALEAASVVLAILPRSTAPVWLDDPARHDRLRAVLTLPPGSFREEGTDVAVDLVVFGPERAPTAPLQIALSTLDAALPDFDLTCSNTFEVRPRPLNPATLRASSASITLPVTGDRRVRVVHDGRKLGLRYACALTHAKVHNALLQRPVRKPSDTHRYPKGIQFHGQGVFDLQLYLAQPDPLKAFESTLNRIRKAGGDPVVDPGVVGYLRRASRRHVRESTPFRHVVRSATAGVPADAPFQVLARKTRVLNPSVWGSPVLKAGNAYECRFVDGRYQIAHPKSADVLALEETELLTGFEFIGGRPANDDGWRVAHEGRVVAFPQLANAIRAEMDRRGITAWLDRDYQQHDLVELWLGRGGVAAWEMALGKARLALALALMGGGRSLIVLEPALIDEMRREIAKIGLAASEWQVIERPEQCERLPRVSIISYNRLRSPIATRRTRIESTQDDDGEDAPLRFANLGVRRTYAHLLRRRVSVLVADEGDCLANDSSQQSRAIAMVSPRRRYLLTGTPIRNMPRDLLGVTGYVGGDGTALQPYGKHYPYAAPYLLAGMDHATRGAEEFATNHLVTEWVTHEFMDSGLRTGAKREVPKVRNIERLRAYAAPLLKRRTQAEPDVAKYIRVTVPNEFTTTVQWDLEHLKHYLAIADGFAEYYRDARKEAEGRGTGLNLIALLARIGAVSRAATCPQYPTPGFGIHAPLTSKQRYLLDRMVALAAEGRKTICVVDQPHMAKLLVAELGKRNVAAVPFHGEIPIVKRVRDMDERFRFGEAPVMVATLDCIQSGYNIPQANYMLFGNRSWVAREERQAMFRMLRGDQERDVDVEYVHLAGSVDEYQAQVVSMKGQTIAATIDFLTPVSDELEFVHMDAILDRFVERLAERSGFDKPYEFRQMLKQAA